MKQYDVIIVGAGAAGLSAAGVLVARGKRVAVLEMGSAPARKVMASGGGRCNITNMAVGRDRYFGENPDFVRGAISRVKPSDITEWATTHGIGLIEKAPGQFFSQDGAGAVVAALMHDANDADFFYNTKITNIQKIDGSFHINNMFRASSVILATGGISFGALGVSDAGYKIAMGFGHKIVPVRPGLCALKITGADSRLAGISLDVEISIGRVRVRDAMLFTHVGIGGPAAYRASLYDLSDGIRINLIPGLDIQDVMRNAKQTNGRKTIAGILGEYIPQRVAKYIAGDDARNIADIKDTDIAKIAAHISDIYIPGNNIQYHGITSAEVVRGGVSTHEISSKTMESKLCNGLFFAGEVMDVAGDLGGFNLHWAWASGRVAGENA